MNAATYSTKSDAVTNGVMTALAGWEDDYDIEALADEVVQSLGGQRGFVVVEGDEFWAAARRHAR